MTALPPQSPGTRQPPTCRSRRARPGWTAGSAGTAPAGIRCRPGCAAALPPPRRRTGPWSCCWSWEPPGPGTGSAAPAPTVSDDVPTWDGWLRSARLMLLVLGATGAWDRLSRACACASWVSHRRVIAFHARYGPGTGSAAPAHVTPVVESDSLKVKSSTPGTGLVAGAGA